MPQLPQQPTLPQLQQFIAELCRQKGWDKNNHLEIMLLLIEEVGELAKEIRKTTKLWASNETPPANKTALENDLLDLTNYFEIDLEKAFIAKNTENLNRTWT